MIHQQLRRPCFQPSSSASKMLPSSSSASPTSAIMRPSGRSLRPAVRAHVVLHQRREQRLRDAEADRAGGEIDVVGVLGARRIGLRALVAAEVLELLAGLLAEQILDRVEDRGGMRLDRDAVLRPQHAEIERRHDGRERGGRGLMAADLQPVGALAQMVGVVDRPGRQPQHLALELAEDGEVVRGRRCEPRACGMCRNPGVKASGNVARSRELPLISDPRMPTGTRSQLGASGRAGGKSSV